MHLLCWLFQFLHLRLPSLSSMLLILKNRILFSRRSGCMPRGSAREGKCINEMRDRQCYLNHLNSITPGLTRGLCCFPDLFSYLSQPNRFNHIHLIITQSQTTWNTPSRSSALKGISRGWTQTWKKKKRLRANRVGCEGHWAGEAERKLHNKNKMNTKYVMKSNFWGMWTHGG